MMASGRLIVAGALLAGFAVGFRTQTLWLTFPLLLLVLADRAGRGLLGAMLGASVAFTVGALAWGIPLLVASGGLDAYLAALGSQAGEDFAGVEMLYLTPTPRLAALALLRTFVWPWDSVALGSVVLTLAAIGALVLAARERRTALAVAAITLPYLAFHLAFQDTTFARYALPLVLPVVFLAAVTLDRPDAPASSARSGWPPGASASPCRKRRLRGARQPDGPALRPGRLGRGGGANADDCHAPGAAASARSRGAARRHGAAVAAAARVAGTGAPVARGPDRAGVVPGRSATHRSGAHRSAGAAAIARRSGGTSPACRCSAACVRPTSRSTASASRDGSRPRAGA